MAATHFSGGKVRLVDDAIITSLSESPKTVTEVAVDIGMTNSYVRLRLKVLLEEGRAALKEVKMVKAGFAVVRVPVYSTEEQLDARRARRILPTQVISIKRDYLVAALFGNVYENQA